MSNFDYNFFHATLNKGQKVERLFEDTANSASGVYRIKQTNWQEDPYDFKLQFKGDDNVYTVELKAAFGGPKQGWRSFCAETYTIGSKPMADWRTHHEIIDYYIVFSAKENAFHVYDTSTLAAYVEKNLKKARINKEGTAYYVHFPSPSHDLSGAQSAGFRTTIPALEN